MFLASSSLTGRAPLSREACRLQQRSARRLVRVRAGGSGDDERQREFLANVLRAVSLGVQPCVAEACAAISGAPRSVFWCRRSVGCCFPLRRQQLAPFFHAVADMFEKELRRRGLDSGSSMSEENLRAASGAQTPSSSSTQRTSPRPAPSFQGRAEEEEESPQLARSRALNSEGLEVRKLSLCQIVCVARPDSASSRCLCSALYWIVFVARPHLVAVSCCLCLSCF